MREIGKFRGKRLDNGERVDGYYFVSTGSLHLNPMHYIIVDEVHDYKSILMEIGGENFACYKVDPETVGQYTGRDKNDREIYQKDKVWLKRHGYEPIKCTAIAGFESWIWLYWKDHSTYHWEVAYYGDIELIKE